MVDAAFWRGRRVFLTGHTGFKGSWLSLWLTAMGAEVFGYALAPATEPNLFETARIGERMRHRIGDIRDGDALREALLDSRAEVVIHMAAQALVRLSYTTPVETYAVNVMGTVNLLEAVRACDTVRAAVVVTSDKSYENREWQRGYVETDAMGGYDPYSSSKGCAELVTAAYRQSFFKGGMIASARAGNVIGGGDWALDRLVPDMVRAMEAGEVLKIRNPDAIRPWQHVLEPLAGYLTLAEDLVQGKPNRAEGWNFGPSEADHGPVRWIADQVCARWGGRWDLADGAHPHESHTLKLDCTKAQTVLGWHPAWTLEQALGSIVDWHQAHQAGRDMQAFTLDQIALYSQGTSR